jgi:hypothetical protein
MDTRAILLLLSSVWCRRSPITRDQEGMTRSARLFMFIPSALNKKQPGSRETDLASYVGTVTSPTEASCELEFVQERLRIDSRVGLENWQEENFHGRLS